MMKKISALIACAALALGGCAGAKSAAPTPENTAETAESAAPKLRVATSLYPLQYLVTQLGGERVEVSTVAPPGVEPHDLELSPKDVADLEQSDLVVYLKGFQSAVDEAVNHGQIKATLDVSPAANLRPAEAAADHGHGTEEDHAHADEHETDHADEHATTEADTHGHDHGSFAFDPHFWLDPNNMTAVAKAVSAKLQQLDPGSTDYFKQQEKEFEVVMDRLAAQAINSTRNCKHRTFVTTHTAFSYLAELTNLQQVALSGLDPEATPSPARIKEISQIMEENGLTTIFTEELVSPKVAQTLAQDLGVETDVLAPIETQSDPAADYAQMFTTDIEKLAKALDCQ